MTFDNYISTDPCQTPPEDMDFSDTDQTAPERAEIDIEQWIPSNLPDETGEQVAALCVDDLLEHYGKHYWAESLGMVKANFTAYWDELTARLTQTASPSAIAPRYLAEKLRNAWDRHEEVPLDDAWMNIAVTAIDLINAASPDAVMIDRDEFRQIVGDVMDAWLGIKPPPDEWNIEADEIYDRLRTALAAAEPGEGT